MKRTSVTALLAAVVFFTPPAGATEYEALREAFEHPDHARWGEVPLWWWEGAPLTKERITAELEELADKGVKAVCPIQRSPGRCAPPSFSPDWWEMLAHAHAECRRLGMRLWVYDQVGYGHYGWLEKAAATLPESPTRTVSFVAIDAAGGTPVRRALPAGTLICARAYPVKGSTAPDAGSVDIRDAVTEGRLDWTPPAGTWKIAVATAAKSPSFYLDARAADAFIDMLYGKIEQTVGKDAMGKSFAGVFQDEHPPTPRDVYTEQLARRFRAACGYDMERAIPALHFDVGPLTQKYRADWFDTYLALVEETYWKKVFDWAERRGILTSHDNWGRKNIVRQSRGYIDYFRSQRWFSAPGYDDAGRHPLDRRNYYDAKIASSIARLYGRPRVWNEAFHSSGWGRTTDETLTWLTTGMVFGANLYDEHGLYYDTRASTWEHAAPDPHWRQPYWRWYATLSDYVARSSFLMVQGTHVVDAAVHYPVASLLAGTLPGVPDPDYNRYMRLSRAIFDAGIDNDIIDDDSILNAEIRDGALVAGGNGYRALVFGPETTVRRAVIEKARRLAAAGGTVLFYGRLPVASTEAGRGDGKLRRLLGDLLGAAAPGKAAEKRFDGGGFAAFVPAGPDRLPPLITAHVARDVRAPDRNVFVTHRRAGPIDIYLLQNRRDSPIDLDARFRTAGVPEIWDAFTGRVGPVRSFRRENNSVRVRHRIAGSTGVFLVFRPGDRETGGTALPRIQPAPAPLPETWAFSVIPTRNNRWGEFRWPPSDERIGPEVRTFRYHDAGAGGEPAPGWQKPTFDDRAWQRCGYGTGPRWLWAGPAGADARIPPALLKKPGAITAGGKLTLGDRILSWRTVAFSKTIGAAKAAPWGGHSGYPDGHIDRNFVRLPKGRKLLFTRLRSPRARRLGLRVALRNAPPRLWVNGERQPFEDAVGNLPLRAGENTVLLDLPDGGTGRLFVQRTPPSVASMEEAARGAVAPDITSASWIWHGDGAACHVRKTVTLPARPQQARIVISTFSGWRLFVNGRRVAEEIGPWADWRRPERFSIAPYLRKGTNVIAVWGQFFAGQNVNKGPAAFARRGIVAAVGLRFPDGSERQIVTDATWRGAVEERDGWTKPGFDAAGWAPAAVRGAMGEKPWGRTVLDNLGPVTAPRRPLSVNLASPYLSCFDEVPDIVYDIKKKDAPRVGCYRFRAPPGLRAFALPPGIAAAAWVDGAPAAVRDGTVRLEPPPRDCATVAIRLTMKPGCYGGAAFPVPLALKLAGGRIRPGPWETYGLPTYAGIGVYAQTLTIGPDEPAGRWVLDLGDVRVAAAVLVNGRRAGVRLARPFRFDLTDHLRPGDNTVTVRVANTIAPHYKTIPALHPGPTASGLLGPVTLRRELAGDAWRAWAEKEAARLRATLATETPAVAAAREQWQQTAGWRTLRPAGLEPGKGVRLAAGGEDWIVVEKAPPAGGTCRVVFPAGADRITGLRVRCRGLPGSGAEHGTALKRIAAELVPPADRRLRGRFVRVAVPDRPEYLALAEVEVLDGDRNIAPAGTARQSSTSHGGRAALAVDGNTDGNFEHGSVSHTGPTPGPWWELDLKKERPIERIRIWNRTDGGLQDRLKGAVVAVLDDKRTVVWRRRIAKAPRPSATYSVSGPVTLDLAPVGNEANAGLPPGIRSRVFRVATPRRPAAGTRLAVDLALQQPVAGFTVAVTGGEPPMCDLPSAVAAALDAAKDRRTAAQREAIRDFYRSVTPLLAAERARQREIRRCLDDVAAHPRHGPDPRVSGDD